MSMKQSPRIKTQINTTHQLVQTIKTAVDKLKTPATVETGLGELKEIMQVHINSTTRMNILITVLSEQNEHMTLTHKKELTKVYGLLGEVFGESLLAFFPKIFATCEARWEDPALHVALSDGLGVMIHHVFRQVNSLEEQVAHLGNLLENLLEAVRQTKQNTQLGAAMCLTRVIQNGPPEAVTRLLPQLTDYLEELFRLPNIKCIGQLLEIVISLILSVELSFEPFVSKFIPSLVENMGPKQDWSVRKLAIDVIYTLAAFLPQTLEGQTETIITLLKEGKTDKSKHVREASHEALLKLKEVRTKEGKQLFETPPRGHRKSEEQKSTPESHKSIFEDPVNPKFMQAAPKSPIEILTVGPLKDFQEEKKNDNILDELKKEIEMEEAKIAANKEEVAEEQKQEEVPEEKELAESQPLMEVEDLASQQKTEKIESKTEELPQQEVAPVEPPKEDVAPPDLEQLSDTNEKPEKEEEKAEKPSAEAQPLEPSAESQPPKTQEEPQPLKPPAEIKPSEPSSSHIVALQFSVDKIAKVRFYTSKTAK